MQQDQFFIAPQTFWIDPIPTFNLDPKIDNISAGEIHRRHSTYIDLEIEAIIPTDVLYLDIIVI